MRSPNNPSTSNICINCLMDVSVEDLPMASGPWFAPGKGGGIYTEMEQFILFSWSLNLTMTMYCHVDVLLDPMPCRQDREGDDEALVVS